MPPPAPSAPHAGERIAKLLARAGVASRREIERMIAEGRVALDGVAVATPATLLASLEGVSVDGRPVAAPAAARLFVYHKPVGLLVTERDPGGRATIYDRLPAGLPRVVPVGRLDLATEGLLLLTTDGGLKRLLELPSTGVERTYRARAYGPISQAQLEELIDGIEVDGIRYGGIDANLERRTGANSWIELTLTEGKNREVRRVLEHLGLQVGRLIRTRYGPFELADLPPGAVAEVREHDIAMFRASLKNGKGGDRTMRVAWQPVVAAPAQPALDGEDTGMPAAAAGRRPAGRRAHGGTPAEAIRTAPARSSDRGGRSDDALPSAAPAGVAPSKRGSPPRHGGRAVAEPHPKPPLGGGGKAYRASSGRSENAQGARSAPMVKSAAAGRDRPNPAAASGAPSSHGTAKRTGSAAGGKREKDGRRGSGMLPDDPKPTRPPRPVRKPGWARPKPRTPRGKR